MAAQLAIKVLSFGFSVIIVRNLGAEDFGQYSAVLAFGALFVFVADLGLSPYSVREVARCRDKPNGLEEIRTIYANIMVMRLLLALLAALLLITTAWLTGRPLVMVGAIALGTLGLLIYSFQGANEAILVGFERLDLTASAKVLSQLFFVVVGTVVLFLGMGYYGLIVANLLGIAVLSYTCWRGVNSLGLKPGRILIHNWGSMLKASLPFGIIGFTLGLSYKFDSVLLNIFRGDVETGYYNAAYNLIFSAVILSNVLNTSLYPSLSRQAAIAPQHLPKIYERSLRYLMLMALPVVIGAWVLADQLILFMFKKAYLPSVPVLQIIIWVVPLMFLSEFLGYVVVVDGKERWVARSIMISTGINITINLILVPTFGLISAALMTVVTEIILVGQYLWLLKKMVRQLTWSHILFRPLLASLLMGGAVFAMRGLPIVANVALSGVIYLILIILLGVVGHEEFSFIFNLRHSSKATASRL
jgi:O-antigen/teichoic acid export membrane protein